MKYLLHAFFLLLFSAYISAIPEKPLTIKDAPLDADPKKCHPKFSVLTSEWAQQNPIHIGPVFVHKYSYVPDCLLPQQPPDFMVNCKRWREKNKPTTFKLTNWYLQNQLNQKLLCKAPEHDPQQNHFDKSTEKWSDDFKSLLKLGASVNAFQYSYGTSCDGYKGISFDSTPLTESTRKQPAVMRLLLEQGAHISVNAAPFDTEQPLCRAAKPLCGRENIETIKMLIESKAQINAVSSWSQETALHSACYAAHSETTKMLLQHGAQNSLTHKDHFGQTPIDRALLPQHCSPRTYNLNKKDLLSVLLLLKSHISTASCLPEVFQHIDEANKWTYKNYKTLYQQHKIQKFLLFHGAPPQTEADKMIKEKIDLTKNFYKETCDYQNFVPPLQTLVGEYMAPNDEPLKDASALERLVLADDFLTEEEIVRLYKEATSEKPPTPRYTIL